MENNPIDTGTFRHYLNFKSLGFSALYQITEPGGFQSENFTIKQNDLRFARDIVVGGEFENLVFERGSKEKGIAPQVIHPNGRISEFLDMGLDWILETIRRFRFEGEIERVLEKDGIQFTVGVLELHAPDTDKLNYYGCRIIQNTNISSYKMQMNTSIDVLATQNIKGDPITPAPTLNVLRRAVPSTATSQWSNTIPEDLVGGISLYTNIFYSLNRQIIQDKIRRTVVSPADTVRFYDGGWREMTFQEVNSGGYTWLDTEEGKMLKLLEASRLLTKISVEVKLTGSLYPLFNTGLGNDNEADFYYFVMVSSEADFLENFNAGNFQKVFNIHYHKNDPEFAINIAETLLFDGVVPIGKNLYGGFSISKLPLSDNLSVNHTILGVTDVLVTVTASELSIDTVMGSVRYIDMIKQCAKAVRPTAIDAEIFDVGGEHYNNVCFNRALLSTRANNSIELFNDFNPEGSFLGQIVYNTNDTITGILPLGLYFWNGTNWISLNSDSIPQVYLTASDDPPGIQVGDLIFNTNPDVSPVGLAYWNGSDYVSLQYSKPFITTTADCFESSMTIETAADYEIFEDKIYFGKFPDFYKNVEIGAFLINPSKKLNYEFNERTKINNIKIEFDTYETNRLTKNSANDMHTEAEWSVPNDKVFEKFDRRIKYIRSGFSAQAMVDLETKNPQTADENDDKVFIVKIIELPPGSFNEFSATLNLSWAGGILQILNKPGTDSNDSDAVINWSILGFSPGDDFFVTINGVIREFTVSSFTPVTLKLDPAGAATDENGDFDVTLKYFYTNVQWQTETNQNYPVILGLENPDKTPNLDYTLRRILDRWLQYFRSSGIAHPDRAIRNLKYVNNPLLKSQRTGEALLSEKGEIKFAEMPNPILGDEIVTLEVYADFASVLTLLMAYSINRGFVRCYDLQRVIRGFITDLNYTWKTGSLKMTLELKYEPEIVVLTFADGILTVNDTTYDVTGVLDWYKITGQNMETFDSQARLLSESRHFSEVSLNGITYDNIDALSEALNEL